MSAYDTIFYSFHFHFPPITPLDTADSNTRVWSDIFCMVPPLVVEAFQRGWLSLPLPLPFTLLYNSYWIYSRSAFEESLIFCTNGPVQWFISRFWAEKTRGSLSRESLIF